MGVIMVRHLHACVTRYKCHLISGGGRLLPVHSMCVCVRAYVQQMLSHAGAQGKVRRSVVDSSKANGEDDDRNN
jgi:hypothetical protein